jgi:AP-2 complex subunit sigma-1
MFRSFLTRIQNVCSTGTCCSSCQHKKCIYPYYSVSSPEPQGRRKSCVDHLADRIRAPTAAAKYERGPNRDAQRSTDEHIVTGRRVSRLLWRGRPWAVSRAEGAMIRFMLLQNRAGKTRCSKYWVPLDDAEKHKLEYEVHRLVVSRNPKFTNFVEVSLWGARCAATANSDAAFHNRSDAVSSLSSLPKQLPPLVVYLHHAHSIQGHTQPYLSTLITPNHLFLFPSLLRAASSTPVAPF